MIKRIGVIGSGYIGLNTALFFAKKGFECRMFDIDKEKCEIINSGEIPIPELKLWLTFDTTELLKNKIRATNDKDVFLTKDYDAIFVAVPTEKNGKPYFDAIVAVVDMIKQSRHANNLIVIESTLTPGVSDTYIVPFLPNFAVAPRRDWLGFDEPGRTLKNLPRIVGGSNDASTEKAVKIIGEVCKEIHPCSYKESELVKSTENSMRHLGSVYAQQLALAYPELDVRKVLELASTKWNVPYYYPNALGSSGYCIPLSSQYILAGATHPNELSIPYHALLTDDGMANVIASNIKPDKERKICILGLAYLGNIKVHILSGGIRLIKALKDNKWKSDNIYVHDPLYTEEEIKEITGCNYIDYDKESLEEMDCIVLASGHDFYEYNVQEIKGEKEFTFVFDNTGIWEPYNIKNYVLTGRRNWLSFIK